MSTKGIYTALSGALAQSQRLDTIANNLANVNTTGFKSDGQVFREYLAVNQRPPDVIQVPKVPASIESFYDMQGGDQSFVDNNGSYINFTQGNVRYTGNNLDLALEGDGFLEVLTPSGVKLTRNGSLSIDGNGVLVTKEGHPVLAQTLDGAGDPATRFIRADGVSQLQLGENGQVLADGAPVSQLSIVQVADKDSLQKIGNSLFDFNAIAADRTTTPLANPSVKVGFLEGSNVNIVKEMTDMISATRTFESAQKAISTYDQINDKLVNVVGKPT